MEIRGRKLAGRSAFSLILDSWKASVSNKTFDFRDFVRRGGLFSFILNLGKEPLSNKTLDYNDFFRRAGLLLLILDSEKASEINK